MNEAVLVATLGSQPQVVTLVLDALLAQGANITRVIVVHTRADIEPIQTSLAALRKEFLVNRAYGDHIVFIPQPLAGSSGQLVDVITPREIDDAFQAMYTLLRQEKLAGHTIHLSMAGGRKTMAVFTMAAAQILFDSEDCLWHLVSSPSLVQSRKFHAENPDDVTLIPVPIAFWRRLRPDEPSRSRDFIEHVLTPAEREIVHLLIREGLSNAALAERLGKSQKTIANQLSPIYAKLKKHFDLSETPDRTILLLLLGKTS